MNKNKIWNKLNNKWQVRTLVGVLLFLFLSPTLNSGVNDLLKTDITTINPNIDYMPDLYKSSSSSNNNNNLSNKLGFTPTPLSKDRAFLFNANVDNSNIQINITPQDGYYIYKDSLSFKINDSEVLASDIKWPDFEIYNDVHFGDSKVYFNAFEITLPINNNNNNEKIKLDATYQGCQDGGICYPPENKTLILSDISIPASIGVEGGQENQTKQADQQIKSTSIHEFLLAIIFGLLGGLILNLMPCVLPVLSLKIFGLTQTGGDRGKAKYKAIWYTVGVVTSFAIIGGVILILRQAGEGLGWGFQLQQPWFVATLIYLMFAVGLSLSGVFSVGNSLGGLGHNLASKNGYIGDFFTGVLACVVASPCIAPFMGGALAFAFGAPPIMSITVFLSLGFGLALPFLLIGFIPSLASKMPKPGAWMDTFKKIMAFPMYLTAIWLMWVLGNQKGVDYIIVTAIGMVVLAFGLWWYEISKTKESKTNKIIGVGTVAASFLPIALVFSTMNNLGEGLNTDESKESKSMQVVGYSKVDNINWGGEDKFKNKSTPTFVNITADWCITCKVNERRVLSSSEFNEALSDTNTDYVVGDWTTEDEDIGNYLKKHDSVGVPLYVYYPGNGKDEIILPTILSKRNTVNLIDAHIKK